MTREENVWYIPLSNRALNCLAKAGYDFLNDSDAGIKIKQDIENKILHYRSIRGMGKITYNEICRWCKINYIIEGKF